MDIDWKVKDKVRGLVGMYRVRESGWVIHFAHERIPVCVCVCACVRHDSLAAENLKFSGL